MFYRLSFFFLLVASLSNAAEVRVLRTAVEARPGMNCEVYLSLPANGPVTGLYYQRSGTGLYSMAALSPTAASLIEKERLARLVLDRPGILPDPSHPEGALVDENTYFKTTHSDLIKCTVQALNWAFQQKELKDVPAVVLAGHSEGTEIVVRSYLELARTKSAVADKVKAFILSGTPMIGIRENLERQLRNAPKEESKPMRAALKARDDKYLLKHGGIPSAYFDEYFAQEPFEKTLERLASLKPKVKIEMFHGLDDRECEVKRVLAFEKQNEQSKNRLDLHVRYYQALHGLNEAAQEDSLAALLRNLR